MLAGAGALLQALFREVVDEESLMADLCTASADEETINRLTRDILMMKLKKVDMRRHVFEVQW